MAGLPRRVSSRAPTPVNRGSSGLVVQPPAVPTRQPVQAKRGRGRPRKLTVTDSPAPPAAEETRPEEAIQPATQPAPNSRQPKATKSKKVSATTPNDSLTPFDAREPTPPIRQALETIPEDSPAPTLDAAYYNKDQESNAPTIDPSPNSWDVDNTINNPAGILSPPSRLLSSPPHPAGDAVEDDEDSFTFDFETPKVNRQKRPYIPSSDDYSVRTPSPEPRIWMAARDKNLECEVGRTERGGASIPFLLKPDCYRSWETVRERILDELRIPRRHPGFEMAEIAYCYGPDFKPATAIVVNSDYVWQGVLDKVATRVKSIQVDRKSEKSLGRPGRQPICFRVLNPVSQIISFLSFVFRPH